MRLLLLMASCFTIMLSLLSKERETDLTPLLNAHDYLVIRFTKHGCPGCLHMNKPIEMAQKKFPAITFIDISYEENKNLANRYKIKAVPTLIFFLKGKDVFHHQGTLTYEALKKLLKSTFTGFE